MLIHCHRVYSDITIDLPDDDPGIQRDNTESHLHNWLENNITVLGEEYEFVASEYQTEHGPVDLLVERNGYPVLLEVKRVATPAAVHQVRRYSEGAAEALPEHGMLLVAVDVRPSARNKAVKYGIDWIQVARSDDGYVVVDTSRETSAD